MEDGRGQRRGTYGLIEGLIFCEIVGIDSGRTIIENFGFSGGVGVWDECDYPCCWDLVCSSVCGFSGVKIKELKC